MHDFTLSDYMNTGEPLNNIAGVQGTNTDLSPLLNVV